LLTKVDAETWKGAVHKINVTYLLRWNVTEKYVNEALQVIQTSNDDDHASMKDI
jgi:hypothetical protein